MKKFIVFLILFFFSSISFAEDINITIPLRPFKLFIEPSTDPRADIHVLWFYDQINPEIEYVIINNDLLIDPITGNLFYIFNQESIILHPNHTYIFTSQAFESSTMNSSLRSNQLILTILPDSIPTITTLPEIYQRVTTSKIIQQ